MITPFLPVVIRSDGLSPILNSGQGNWGDSNWKIVLACGIKNNLIVSGLHLNNRSNTNPVALEFAKRLLNNE